MAHSRNQGSTEQEGIHQMSTSENNKAKQNNVHGRPTKRLMSHHTGETLITIREVLLDTAELDKETRVNL